MIKRLYDLSFQQKIPLWGAVLIIVSILSVSGVLMYRAYSDLKATLIDSAGSLGATLAQTMIPPLLHDDVWRGFEILRAPFNSPISNGPVSPRVAIVLTNGQQVFVASDPDQFPMLSALDAAGPDYRFLAREIADKTETSVLVVEPAGSDRLFVAVPMIDSGTVLGTLVLAYSRASLHTMFLRTAMGGALLGLIVLAVLLPINWYWGNRMATPLVRLSQRMDEIQHRLPEKLEPELYNYGDELGRMFKAYNRMVGTMREKALLERGMASAERLAAVGRLTAGIAHEINNPLAGMLTALDTLKKRGDVDERTARTLDLLERGLMQVRDTVAALLVEVRQEKRIFNRHDIEDVETLIQPSAARARAKLEFAISVPASLPIAAGPVRQILINLLNNALHAVDEDGWITCAVSATDRELRLQVNNSGDPIPPERLENLFEPFVSYSEGGLGLGLWVTYQLVSQLAGQIEVSCGEHSVHFMVNLPIESDAVAA